MPGRGTEPGPVLYPECGQLTGPRKHRREGTRTCAPCRAVQAAYQARYRVQRIVVGPRLVPALGVHRRVRALARLGWAQDDIAGRLGIVPYRFKKVMGHADCRRDLAEQVAALYRDLLDQDGPNRWARAHAERKGWPGPMDWDNLDDPAENPVAGIVVDRDHAEALVMHSAWRRAYAAEQHNQRKRDARAVARLSRERQRQPAMAS